MSDDSVDALGSVARALVSSERTGFTDESDADFARAVLEIAALHAAEYQIRDADEVHLALTRIVMRQIPGVDRALIEWLAEKPSNQRAGVVYQMLWHLWSTAVPHPPIDPALVQALIATSRYISLGAPERGAYVVDLNLASKQLTDTATLKLIEEEIERV